MLDIHRARLDFLSQVLNIVCGLVFSRRVGMWAVIQVSFGKLGQILHWGIIKQGLFDGGRLVFGASIDHLGLQCILIVGFRSYGFWGEACAGRQFEGLFRVFVGIVNSYNDRFGLTRMVIFWDWRRMGIFDGLPSAVFKLLSL